MTSDAKIGLLLGLVFIFVIAFVINGLPGLHHKDDSNKLTTNMVGLQNSPSGIGANERRVALDQQASSSGTAPTDARFTMPLSEGASVAGDTARLIPRPRLSSRQLLKLPWRYRIPSPKHRPMLLRSHRQPRHRPQPLARHRPHLPWKSSR